MATISWATIESECGDYRDGFVATFRKYEGQDTDERDARSRPVKVTIRSFARHVGIPETTFQRWVKRTGEVRQPQARQASQVAYDVRRGFRDHPETAAQAIVDNPEALAAIEKAQARQSQPREPQPHAWSLLANARRLARDLEQLVKDASQVTLDDEMREALKAVHSRLTAGVGFLESVIGADGLSDEVIHEWLDSPR